MISYFKNIFTGLVSLVQGLVVTFKNLVSRPTTIQYPTQKLPMSRKFRGLVDLRPEKCIMCYQCSKICPTGCIEIKHKETPEKKKSLETFKHKVELCCFCGLCEQVCPTQAIYMNKIYEIAVYSRQDLNVNLLDPEKYAKWENPPVK